MVLEDGSVTKFELGSSWMLLLKRVARGSRIFSNMGDILTEVIHLYSTGGLICYWRIRGNERCIVNHLTLIQTD